jgi:hypothetical protein
MTELTRLEEERLRLALGLIADEAGRDAPAPRPAPQAVWWRRHTMVTTALGAAAAVCALLVGLGALGDTGPAGSGSGSTGARDNESGDHDSSQGQSSQEYIACARMIAEGDVLAVREAPQQGRVLVTFAVQDWIKPTEGADEVELDLVDPTAAGISEPWAKGQHVLIVVPSREDLVADSFSGSALAGGRSFLEHYLPEAAGVECPPYWKNTQN